MDLLKEKNEEVINQHISNTEDTTHEISGIKRKRDYDEDMYISARKIKPRDKGYKESKNKKHKLPFYSNIKQEFRPFFYRDENQKVRCILEEHPDFILDKFGNPNYRSVELTNDEIFGILNCLRHNVIISPRENKTWYYLRWDIDEDYRAKTESTLKKTIQEYYPRDKAKGKNLDVLARYNLYPGHLLFDNVIYEPMEWNRELNINDKRMITTAFNTYSEVGRNYFDRELLEQINIHKPHDSIKPWLDHIYNIWAQCDDNLYHWIIQWFAHTLQKPWEKKGTAIVLHSMRGSGKGIIINKFAEMLGKNATIYDQTRSRQFNSIVADKTFVFLDECSYLNQENMEDVKKLITEPEIITEAKFENQRMVKNYANLIFATNNYKIFNADITFRRFTILELDDKYSKLSQECMRLKSNPETFEQGKQVQAVIHEYFQKIKDVDLKQLYHYLMSYPVQFEDVNSIIPTQKFNDIIDNGKPELNYVLESFMEDQIFSHKQEIIDDVIFTFKLPKPKILGKLGIQKTENTKRNSVYRKIEKLFGDSAIEKKLSVDGKRPRGYIFPDMVRAIRTYNKNTTYSKIPIDDWIAEIKQEHMEESEMDDAISAKIDDPDKINDYITIDLTNF